MHRRLGKLLPYQLANAPRAHLKADYSFDSFLMRGLNVMRY